MRRTSRPCWPSLPRRSALLLALAAALPAQVFNSTILVATPPPKLVAKRGQAVTIPLQVSLRQGYHVNSNAKPDEWSQETVLTWQPGPVRVTSIAYPKAETMKLEFSSKPLAVYTGDFTITTSATVPKDAPAGATTLQGSLVYQACTDKSCYPKKIVKLSVPVEVQ